MVHLEFSHTVGENIKLYHSGENCSVVSQKFKIYLGTVYPLTPSSFLRGMNVHSCKDFYTVILQKLYCYPETDNNPNVHQKSMDKMWCIHRMDDSEQHKEAKHDSYYNVDECQNHYGG